MTDADTRKPAPDTEHPGATVVISHAVREGRQADYERWLDEISPLCKASPGYLDWHMVRPIPGLTTTYAVIVRFDTEVHLAQWMQSPDRTRLIEKVKPLLERGDDYRVHSGFEFWFAPANAKTPARWKQFLVTWSAIFPLVFGVTSLVVPALQHLGAPPSRPLSTLLITGAVVWLMVYVVMPRYTRLIRNWFLR